MFGDSFRFICVCFFLQTIAGKSIDLEYGYQEIDETPAISRSDSEEFKHIEVDRLSDEAIEELCKNFRITIHIKETDAYINCFQSLFNDERHVNLVKRDVSDKNEEIEGSGDSGDPRMINPNNLEEPTVSKSAPAEATPVEVANEVPKNSSEPEDLPKSSPAREVPDQKEVDKTPATVPPVNVNELEGILKNNPTLLLNVNQKENDNNVEVNKNSQQVNLSPGAASNEGKPASTESPVNKGELSDMLKNKSPFLLLNVNQKENENPVETNKTSQEGNLAPAISNVVSTDAPLYRSGFDDIVKKNNPELAQNNDTKSNDDSKAAGQGTLRKENIAVGAPNDVKAPVPAGEIAKTGESQEKPTTASNSMLLIVFAALGVVGTLAFAFNFIKKRRENREIDEVMQLESEGRELKEMKPLMKPPLLSQNGAKSLEFIDAEPQNGSTPDIRTT